MTMTMTMTYDFTALRKRVKNPKLLDEIIESLYGKSPSPTHLMWKTLRLAEGEALKECPPGAEGRATDAVRFKVMDMHDIVMSIAEEYQHCRSEFHMMDFRLRIGKNQRRLGL